MRRWPKRREKKETMAFTAAKVPRRLDGPGQVCSSWLRLVMVQGTGKYGERGFIEPDMFICAAMLRGLE